MQKMRSPERKFADDCPYPLPNSPEDSVDMSSP
jgi:hypothetical protein